MYAPTLHTSAARALCALCPKFVAQTATPMRRNEAQIDTRIQIDTSIQVCVYPSHSILAHQIDTFAGNANPPVRLSIRLSVCIVGATTRLARRHVRLPRDCDQHARGRLGDGADPARTAATP